MMNQPNEFGSLVHCERVSWNDLSLYLESEEFGLFEVNEMIGKRKNKKNEIEL